MRVRGLFFLGLLLIIGVAVLFSFDFNSASEADLYSLFRQGDYETIVSLPKPTEEETLFLYLVSLLYLDQEEEIEKEIPSLQTKDYFWLDHFLYLYSLHFIEKGDLEKATMAKEKLENSFPSSPLLPYITLSLAQYSLQNDLFASALAYSIQVLTYSESEENSLSALKTIFQSLAHLGYLEEATLLLRHIYYDFPTMSSRVSRELIQPWISQISPEKFSPSQRLSVADFLFSLGFRTEAGVFLDQIEEALLPPSLQKNMFILRARFLLGEEDWKELERLINENLLRKGEREEILFYRGVLEQRKANYSKAVQIYERLLFLYPDSEYAFNTYQNLAFSLRIMGEEQKYLEAMEKITLCFPEKSAPFWELFQFYYNKNQLPLAQEMLEKLKSFPEEKNKALFWLFKIDSSLEHLQEIVESGKIDYYYVRAWQELKIRGENVPFPFEEEAILPQVDSTNLSYPEHWTKYQFLAKIEMWRNAEIEILFLLSKNSQKKGLYRELSEFYAQKGDYQKSILYSLYLQEGEKIPLNLARQIYPEFFLPSIQKLAGGELDPYLILAIVRAESFFDPVAVSSAGAIGLAQIMPSTALWVIEKGWTNFDDEEEDEDISLLLLNAEKNLEIGISYFSYLWKRFEGKLYPAICSYNAGPGRVDQWLETLSPDPELFVESIPFPETQNYLKKVMANYFAYSLLYQGDFNPPPYF
ncbi:MAG TPA: transglycosylase SLT domain-containing protein [Candidatus Atribacteria bacterium]|nr:transglycosylase SLT domain-containing protein [Candidatus Atribacteria bacterium]